MNNFLKDFTIAPTLGTIVSLTLLLTSCTEKSRTPSSSPSDAVVYLYTDLELLKIRAQIDKLDSLTTRAKEDSLMRLYGLNHDQYEGAMNSSKTDLESWKQFNERVLSRLEKLQHDLIPRIDSTAGASKEAQQVPPKKSK